MGILITWLGHASFKIKADKKTIYLDPYEGEYEDKADLILVSHSHYDHCDDSKIKKIRRDDTLIIADSDCVSKIEGNVKPLKPGDHFSLNTLFIKAVDAYNYKRFRSPGNPYHPRGFGVGYLLTINEKTIYHAGDTDYVPEMRDLEKIHLALLPSGGTYTMDNREAIEAALAIKPRFVIPMHRWNTKPNELKREIEEKSETEVILLNPGEYLEI